MIREAASVPEDSVLEADVCIVGGGAAGITLARELAGASRRVLLLESGGVAREEETQALYAGGPPSGFFRVLPDYLEKSRLRWLGGTTNHWLGYCRPLDPIDMQSRDWIPNSGWPFERARLDPFYRRAADVLEIEPFEIEPGEPGRAPLDLDPALGLRTSVYQLSPPTRFGERYRDDLERLANLEVLLHANAVDLRCDADGRRVERVAVATLGGRRFALRARAVVLAAGALENARLLLSSDSVHPKGVGNDHDLVGRYFTDHVYGVGGIGRVVLVDSTRSLSLYHDQVAGPVLETPHVGVLSLSPELQREHALPNHQYRLHAAPPEDSGDPFVAALAAAVRDLAQLPAAPGAGPHVSVLEIGSELSADPDNRVWLGPETDALGMRRLEMHWDLTPFDRQAMLRSVRVFARQMGRSMGARVQVRMTEDFRWPSLFVGSHHMGTTRMHEDPKRGVVDADGRVHGIANLWVAGSSVYPTPGRPNPTFTLVALALRLADHLRAEIAS